MGRTTDLRRELKRRFYPFVTERGFQIDMAHSPFGIDFRRISVDGIDVFDLKWEKYGRPRFVVNFGNCPANGVTHFGERVPPEKVLSYMGSLSGRLQPTKGASTRSWFCQDRSLFRRVVLRQQNRPAANIVDELLSLFPELEDWFQNRRLGPHLVIINYPWRDRADALE